nr:hypothetical protein [Chloroflexota bacterium]
VVAAVDRPLLGQLAPGGTLHFAEITIVDAQTAYREQMAALRRAAAALLRRDPWEQLPDASASW